MPTFPLDVLDKIGYYLHLRQAAIISNHAALDIANSIGYETSNPYFIGMRIFEAAAASGDLLSLQWLYENSLLSGSECAFDAAAQEGHLQILEWLKSKGDFHSSMAMDKSAKNGHLAVVKYLHDQGKFPCSKHAMNAAAGNGHLETVIWLHNNRSEGCTTDAMDWAAQRGYVDVVKFLNFNRTEGCTVAALNGSDVVREYLLDLHSKGESVRIFGGKLALNFALKRNSNN